MVLFERDRKGVLRASTCQFGLWSLALIAVTTAAFDALRTRSSLATLSL